MFSPTLPTAACITFSLPPPATPAGIVVLDIGMEEYEDVDLPTLLVPIISFTDGDDDDVEEVIFGCCP